MAYDAVGNVTTSRTYSDTDYFMVTQTTDPNLHNSYAYSDGLGRTLKTVSGAGGQTHYSYDSLNRLEYVSNPIGEDFEYVYNEIDQVFRKKIPGAGPQYFWYDEFFRLAASKDANNNYLFYQYDDFNRLLEVHFIKEDDSGGADTEPLGLPASGILTTSALIAYCNNPILTNSYADGKTWLEESTETVFNGDGTTSQKTINHLDIDALGRPVLSAINYPGNAAVQIDNVYNDAGLLEQNIQKITPPGSGSPRFFSHKTTYDNLLRPAANSLNGQVISVLEYDAMDRLEKKKLGAWKIGEEKGFLQTIDYLYDDAGKLTQINTPVSPGCNNIIPFCQLEAQYETGYENGVANCSMLTSISVDDQVFQLEVPVDILRIDNALADNIEQALRQAASAGQGSQHIYFDGEVFRVSVVIKNTDAQSVVLHFSDGCKITLTATDCCTLADTDEPDTTDPILNDDLYFQHMTYDGLDITTIELENGSGLFRHNYTYDGDHRLTNHANKVFCPEYPRQPYSSAYTYDPAGNILTLKRRGRAPLLSGSYNFELIDNLDYTYENNNTSRLQSVVDDVQGFAQANGFKPAISNYTYDNNGNVKEDSGKGLGISYNLLNLPASITAATGNMLFDYSFSGEKIKKTVTGGNSYTKHYLSGAEFKDNQWEAYYHSEGRVLFSENEERYQYNLKDHLGNTVASFEDKDGDGFVDPVSEVLQRSQYYPFGMQLDLPETGVLEEPGNLYLYNGKELTEDLQLNWLDFGFRWYDPAIARFPSVDPIIEEFPYLTAYNYASNNPITNIDLWGLQGANFNNKDVSRMQTYFKKNAQNYQAGRSYDDCITCHNKGMRLLLNDNSLRVGSQADITRSRMQAAGHAGETQTITFNQTDGSKAITPDQVATMDGSLGKTAGNLAEGIDNSVFGVSIVDGYHTMTLTVTNTVVNGPVPEGQDTKVNKNGEVVVTTYTMSDQGTGSGTNGKGNLSFRSAEELDAHLTTYVQNVNKDFPAKIEIHQIED